MSYVRIVSGAPVNAQAGGCVFSGLLFAFGAEFCTIAAAMRKKSHRARRSAADGHRVVVALNHDEVIWRIEVVFAAVIGDTAPAPLHGDHVVHLTAGQFEKGRREHRALR